MAHREPGDFADFLVAEVVLKFELQHFLLPRREGCHDPKKKTARLRLLYTLVRRGIVAFIFFEQFFIEIGHALFLSANVEGAVAADGKKPLGRGVIELAALAPLQLDKSFLHHIASPVAIAEDAGRILQQWQFEPAKKRRQVVIGWDWFGHAHKLFPGSNPPTAELLNQISQTTFNFRRSSAVCALLFPPAPNKNKGMKLHACFRRAGRLGLLPLVILSLHSAQAGSATWNAAPTSGSWGLATNWTPATVPSTTEDTATFQAATITTIIDVNLNVGSIVFDPGASAYTLNRSNPYQFTMSGTGVVNNSGIMQTINVPAVPQFVGDEESENLWTIAGSASAGNLVQYSVFGSSCADGKTDKSGVLDFVDTTTAGSATFVIYPGGRSNQCLGYPGRVSFSNSSSAEDATFICNGAGRGDAQSAFLFFVDNATAANATIVNNGGTVKRAGGGLVYFYDQSSAGNATITSNGGSVAEASGSRIAFIGAATAGNATLIANGGRGEGAQISFTPYLSGTPNGGTARIEVFGNGQLDNSGDAADLTIGSLEGDGLVFIGGNKLTIGSNNLSTTFSGVTQDGGNYGGVGGSLTKTGTGKLTLTGANTYTGGTAIDGGTLSVNNATGSGLGSGPLQVTTGTLGGSGIISGAVTVGTGSGEGAFLAPAAGTTKQANLTMQSGLIFNADATYTYTFKAKKKQTRTDKVVANGVTINGATFAFQGTAQSALKQGLVLTAISNTAATPIAGTFANLPDGAILTVNGNNFQASYEGGDGNDLTLTVVP